MAKPALASRAVVEYGGTLLKRSILTNDNCASAKIQMHVLLHFDSGPSVKVHCNCLVQSLCSEMWLPMVLLLDLTRSNRVPALPKITNVSQSNGWLYCA